MDKVWLKARRVISVLLVFTMLASITPVQAFADDSVSAETTAADTASEEGQAPANDSAEPATIGTENEEETQAPQGGPENDGTKTDGTVTEAAAEPAEPAGESAAAQETPQADPQQSAAPETPAQETTADAAVGPAEEEAAGEAVPGTEPAAADPQTGRQTLTAAAEGVTVSVTAELPADTQLVVTKKSGDDLGDDNMEALMEAVNSNNIREIEVYDIGLSDAQGNVYTLPQGQTAAVTLAGIAMQEAEGRTLYAAHLKADGSADMGSIQSATATFTVDSFGPFAVAAVGSTEPSFAEDSSREQPTAAPEESDEIDGASAYAAVAGTYASRMNYFTNSTTDPHVHIYYSVDGKTIEEIASGKTIELPEINADAIRQGIVGIEFYIAVDTGFTYGTTTFTGKQDKNVRDIDDGDLQELSAYDWFTSNRVSFGEAIRLAKSRGAVKAFLYQDNGLAGMNVGTRTFAVSTNMNASFAVVTYHNTKNDQSKTFYLEKGVEATAWNGVDIDLNWSSGSDQTHLVGWSTTSGGDQAYGLSETFTPTQDLDLYTVWEKDEYAYTVRYYYDGVPGVAPEGATEGGRAALDATVSVSPAQTVQIENKQYALDRVDPENRQIPITQNEKANVISVYYGTDSNKDGKADAYQVIATLENRTREYTGEVRYGYGSDAAQELTFTLADGQELPDNVQVVLNGYQAAEGTDVGTYSGNAQGASVTVLVDGRPDTRYSLLRVDGGSLTVTPKPLHVTVSFQDRVYQAGNLTVRAAGASIDAGQVADGDIVTVSASGTGTILSDSVQDNAMVSSQVQPVLGGADAGNYLLGTVSCLPVNILGVVTYDTNAGNDTATWTEDKTYHCNETVSLTEVEPTRYGYTFLGWSADPDARTPDKSFAMHADGLKLFAVWQAQDVKITVNYHYGKEATVTGNVSNKKFDGSLVIGMGAGSYDLTLAAKTKYAGAEYALSSVEMGKQNLFTLDADNYRNPTMNETVSLQDLTVTVDVYYVADNGGDGIPDQYQVTVNYAVAKGNWDDNTDGIRSETVTLMTDGRWDENGSGTLSEIPQAGTMADEGYTAGSWDIDPQTALIRSSDAGKTFTYTYGVDADRQYAVTYTAQANGSVSSAAEKAQVLGTAGLQGSAAAPANGYVFDGWYKGDSKISSEAVLSAGTVAAYLNKTLNAHGETVYQDTEFSARFTVRTDLSYTVRYLEDGTAGVLAGEKTVGGQTFGATVTETAPDIAGYTLTSDKNPQNLTIGTGDNVITFYYKAVGETAAAAPAPAALAAPAAPAASATPTTPAGTTAPAVTSVPEENVTEEPEETIREEETPLAPQAGEESIGDEATPLAGGNTAWALLNLVLAVLTALGGVVLALGYLLRRKGSGWCLAALVPAIGTVAAFLLTEDMSLQMAFVDRWTLLMALIAVIQVVIAVLSRKDNQNDEDETNA